MKEKEKAMEKPVARPASSGIPSAKDVPDGVTSFGHVPPHNWRDHWLTVQEFSRMVGRPPQTVYWWVNNGILAEFGVPSCQFRHGRPHSGRVFILNIF